MKAKMKNTLMHSPKEKPSTSLDVSTAVQMDIISVKIVLDHQPNAVNAIGLKEITRRPALNPGRSERPRKIPLKIREKAKQLERSGCSSCQNMYLVSIIVKIIIVEWGLQLNWSLAGAPNWCLILLILTPLAQSQTMLIFASLAIET